MPDRERLPSVDWDGRVLRHEGLLWKRRRGATSTPEQFLAARANFLDLHDESIWSPWVFEERAANLEATQAVMRRWKRAERGFRQMTAEELDEDLAGSGSRWGDRPPVAAPSVRSRSFSAACC